VDHRTAGADPVPARDRAIGEVRPGEVQTAQAQRNRMNV